jgi:hypothetical protein
VSRARARSQDRREHADAGGRNPLAGTERSGAPSRLPPSLPLSLLVCGTSSVTGTSEHLAHGEGDLEADGPRATCLRSGGEVDLPDDVAVVVERLDKPVPPTGCYRRAMSRALGPARSTPTTVKKANIAVDKYRLVSGFMVLTGTNLQPVCRFA